jgi:hypothetical protein
VYSSKHHLVFSHFQINKFVQSILRHCCAASPALSGSCVFLNYPSFLLLHRNHFDQRPIDQCKGKHGNSSTIWNITVFVFSYWETLNHSIFIPHCTNALIPTTDNLGLQDFFTKTILSVPASVCNFLNCKRIYCCSSTYPQTSMSYSKANLREQHYYSVHSKPVSFCRFQPFQTYFTNAFKSSRTRSWFPDSCSKNLHLNPLTHVQFSILLALLFRHYKASAY